MGDAMQSVWEVREGAHGHLTRIYTEGGGWLVANAEPYVAQHIVTLHNLWLRKLEVGPTEGSEGKVHDHGPRFGREACHETLVGDCLRSRTTSDSEAGAE